MSRRPQRPAAELPPVPTNEQLLETLLNTPGGSLDKYSQLHPYSARNIGWVAMQFAMQGRAPQPIASFQRWKDLGRHVKRGESASYVLRPIVVKSKDEVDDQGNPKVFARFKPVKSVFGVEQTEGEELPPMETREWKLARAIGKLSIKEVKFETFEANVQGYSYDRNIAISPIAFEPLRTAIHEIAHIQSGHTTPDKIKEYQQHRGRFEFEAEAPAYLTMNRLGELDDHTAGVSRSYCQTWLRGETPSEQSISRVLRVHDEIYQAGLEEAVDLSEAS